MADFFSGNQLFRTLAILLMVWSGPALAYTQMPFIEKTPPRIWEQTPFVIGENLYRAGFMRPKPHDTKAIVIEQYDPEKNVFWKVAELPWDLGLGCLLVDGNDVWVFGSTDWTAPDNEIRKQKIDPDKWTFSGDDSVVVQAPAGKSVFNCSVTKGPDKYVMVYETNEFKAFTGRFIQSTDLETWSPIGEPLRPEVYNACQTIKYVGDGWYMVTWLWFDGTRYMTNVGRTRDFVTVEGWQGNATYPATTQLLVPGKYEGINASDNDFVEWNGKVYGTYFTGDQGTWGVNSDWWYAGTLADLYHEMWP
ncbi:hypothetical protein IB237_24035 [Agrobacterium sp. AGB01]|uniref:hypothetical protein n=1 Tax=Agrobacterium sp. AGB01 TaxID=2769302 RepID=UPI00177F74A9|nr:hypothetical protein [Agrobacterium sp. AGB01]MBD9390275.1 hypothetical protein [Agrobacterium sp. AGB01]